MNNKLSIGICRTAPISLIASDYEENDISVHFIKGFIDMFGDQELILKSPTTIEQEKIFNNQKLFSKYPYIKDLEYAPFEKSKLDVLFIFSKDDTNKTYYLQDGTSYEKHIQDVIDENENLLIIYIQYNDVCFDFEDSYDFEKNNFLVLLNSPKSSSILYTDKFYGDKDINGYCLDLNEFVFNNRISNRKNFFNKVSLFNTKGKNSYEELKNPNSMREFIHTLNEFNDNDDNDYLKNNFTYNHSIFIEQLQSSNFVIIDNNFDKDFYNVYYFLIANYTYPVLLNKDVELQIELDPMHTYNYTDIDNYYSQKYIKQIRVELKNYFKTYDLKNKILEIIKRESINLI